VVRLPYLRALPAWRVNDALAARLPDLPQQASGASVCTALTHPTLAGCWAGHDGACSA
jgi:hypothetical protein